MNNDQYKLKRKLYHFKYSHKCRGYDITASYEEIMKKLLKTNGKCMYCCEPVGLRNLTFDMIDPSIDKKHCIDDIAIVCRICNSAKNNKNSFHSIGFKIGDKRVSWIHNHQPELSFDNNRLRWFPFYKNAYSHKLSIIFFETEYTKLRTEAMNWKKYPRRFYHGMKESDV